MNDNFLEILVALGVDDTSTKNNINEYIKNLKNLSNIKVALDVDGATEVNKDFNNMSKTIESLQNQITSLQRQLKDVNIGIDSRGIESFRQEIGNSIKSVDDLKKAVARFNGDLTLSFGKVTTDDGLKQDILKSVNATITDAEGDIKKIKYKPIIDSVGNIQGLEEISSKISKVDFKDFDSKAEKTRLTIAELGRQGYISSDQIAEFEMQLTALGNNKSVRALAQLESQIKELNRELAVDVKTNNALVNLENQARKLLTTLDKLKGSKVISDGEFNNLANDIERVGTSSISTVNDIGRLNSEFKSLESIVGQLATKNAEINKIDIASQNLTSTVDRLNTKLDLTVSKLGSNLNTANVESLRTQISQIANTEIKSIDDIARLNSLISQTEKNITQLGVSGNAIDRFENTVRKTTNAINDLERTGYATAESIESFRTKLNDIPTGDLNRVKSLLNEINDELKETATNRSNFNTLSSLSRELGTIEASLERTRSLYARTFDPTVSARLNQELNQARAELERISRIGAEGGLVTTEMFDRVRRTFADLTVDARNFNAQATTAVRNSVGLVDALATAFTKFPIWIAASTAFYGTLRGVTDLTEKVIELDTALTNLIRVVDAEQFEFDQVIDRSIASVTALSGEVSSFLELVAEFGRTGKTIDESFALAETTTTLMNISELNATEAVNSLTAAMIAFNIEAEDSARIADKLNEVNNNQPPFMVT